jgi:hypothetical protein
VATLQDVHEFFVFNGEGTMVSPTASFASGSAGSSWGPDQATRVGGRIWGGRKDSEGFHIGIEAGGAAGFTVGSVRLEQSGGSSCQHCTSEFTIQGQKVGGTDGEWLEVYSFSANEPPNVIRISVDDATFTDVEVPCTPICLGECTVSRHGRRPTV